ncbi:MAG: putative bifunctional diguanylate cyclase/phosphodiesterase [Gammaproteobacteria bacterium]
MMTTNDSAKGTLSSNVRLLKDRASKFSIYGALIATIAIMLATLLVSYQQFGEYSLSAFIQAQQDNPVLWLLDIMPFVFGFWGQYATAIMAYEAGALIVDQTHELRAQTANLESQANYHTTHDGLTELPNRVLFSDRAQQALASAQRDKYPVAILMLGLHDFKEINTTLGHYNGDRLLKHVAARLTSVVRGSDTVARLGGDEFGILLPRIGDQQDGSKLGQKLIRALEMPFELDGLSIGIQASIGIALHPLHGGDADTLLQRAHVAMNAARKNNSGIMNYEEDLDQHSPQRLTLMGELRQAIARDELLLHFQPKVDIHRQRLTGVEALVRWQHKQHGLIGPDEFIPLAERTGLIKPLTQWVLKQALRQQRSWLESGMDIGIAINLSAQSLLDQDLPDMLAGMLASYEVPHQRLTLEITESAMMQDPQRTQEILKQLNKMGLHLSIDDFGTGYSSLAYLSKLPVDEIKIDKSFVMSMSENENNAMIVRTTIDLAHNLNLKVIAEGVEDQQTLEMLQTMGCDHVQGYHVSRPMAAEKLAAWLQDDDWPLLASTAAKDGGRIYPFKKATY